jgi:hypothetical protein
MHVLRVHQLQDQVIFVPVIMVFMILVLMIVPLVITTAQLVHPQHQTANLVQGHSVLLRQPVRVKQVTLIKV